jgi:flagellar biosynthesis protein FliQ
VAGLLTKAYFLVFAVLSLAVAAVLIWRRPTRVKTALAAVALVLALAGPWYARNLVLYKNISGTHEEFNGIGIRQALAAAPRIDWVATTGFLARSSLWTGNNSFTNFSQGTLNMVLALLLLALAAWGLRRRVIQPAERIVFSAIVLFSVAVAYASCASFADRNGDAAGASPWYTQVLLAPVMALAYLGMSRWKGFGPVLAGSTVAIWTWVLVATWTVKLFPMYSGGGAAPMRMHDVWNWYAHGAAAHTRDLSLVALAPAPWLYVGLLISLTLSIWLSAAMIRDLTSSPDSVSF